MDDGCVLAGEQVDHEGMHVACLYALLLFPFIDGL